MQKEIPPAALFAVGAAIVLLLGFFIYRGIRGDQSSAPTQMGAQLPKILERTGGDVSKMSADEKKIYDDAVRTGYYRPTMSGAGAMAPRSQGTSGGPGSYPAAPRPR